MPNIHSPNYQKMQKITPNQLEFWCNYNMYLQFKTTIFRMTTLQMADYNNVNKQLIEP
jgi:hypothetical protein